MVNLTNYLKQHKMVLPLTLALVSLAVSLTMVRVISAQAKVVLARKVTLAQLKADLKRLDAILADKKQYAEVIQKVSQTLPREYREVAFAVSTLEQIAREHNQTLDLNIDEQAKPDPAGPRSITLVLRTSSSYNDLQLFLTSLARLPYHTRVDLLQTDETGSKISSMITLRLYLQAL